MAPPMHAREYNPGEPQQQQQQQQQQTELCRWRRCHWPAANTTFHPKPANSEASASAFIERRSVDDDDEHDEPDDDDVDDDLCTPFTASVSQKCY